MMQLCAGQYVYKPSRSSREVGLITSVHGTSAKVSWDVDKPSHLSDTQSLRLLTITVGTCVVHGSYGTAVPFLSSPLTIPMGIVTDINGQHCTVIWDNSSTEIVDVDNLRDVAHLPLIRLDKVVLVREWLIEFQVNHNVDLSTNNDNRDYVCARTHHQYITGYEHCIHCRPPNQKRRHNVTEKCRCSFRLFLTKNNGIAFAGAHDIHIPGKCSFCTFITVAKFAKLC
jgi:hypothetical protein